MVEAARKSRLPDERSALSVPVVSESLEPPLSSLCTVYLLSDIHPVKAVGLFFC